jgi:hypothetical protein
MPDCWSTLISCRDNDHSSTITDVSILSGKPFTRYVAEYALLHLHEASHNDLGPLGPLGPLVSATSASQQITISLTDITVFHPPITDVAVCTAAASRRGPSATALLAVVATLRLNWYVMKEGKT